MGGPLDYQTLIPVKFQDDEILTAESLNRLQRELLAVILEHTHAGNDRPKPQGVPLKRDAIDREEILGNHIRDKALVARHFEAGAVDSNAIGDKMVLERHLAPGAVGNAALGGGAVTREKLSPDVASLLDNLAGASSTYGYFAYLDGRIIYPPKVGNWYDWMLDDKLEVMSPAMAIMRITADGNWQPTRTAGRIEETPPPVAYDFAAGTTVTMRKTASAPRVTAAPIDVSAAVGEIPTVMAKAGLVGDYRIARWAKLPEDLLLRKQTKVDIDTAKYPGLLPLSGKISLNPGVGGTEAFRREGPMDFRVAPGKATYQHWDVARRIAYHLGIEVGTNHWFYNWNTAKESETLLRRLYDVMQNPERVLAGYWTGPSQNVRSVVRLTEKGTAFVRITFGVPYTTQAYTVQVTPDFTGEGGWLAPIIIRRQREYVDVAFWDGDRYTNTAHFSLSVVGELNVS